MLSLYRICLTRASWAAGTWDLYGSSCHGLCVYDLFKLTQLSVGPPWRSGPWAFSILLSVDTVSLLACWHSILFALIRPSHNLSLLHGQRKAGRVSRCPTKTRCSPWGRNTHGPWSGDHYYQDNSEKLSVSPGCFCKDRVQPRQCKDPSIST